jgi:hypothetical protein
MPKVVSSLTARHFRTFLDFRTVQKCNIEPHLVGTGIFLESKSVAFLSGAL